ncbi:MAG: YcnI family protein [Actinomycetes bacterium]
MTALPAAGHVTVKSTDATAGGFGALTFRVPTEGESATVGLEVTFPADQPLAFVSVKPHPGWSYKVSRARLADPVEVEGRKITEAVSRITWTATGGNGIGVGEYDEFSVSAGPLPEADQMVFKAVQVTADGERVGWVEEAAPGSSAELERPAPVLRLAGSDERTGTRAADASSPGADGADEGDVRRATIIAVAALAVGLVSGAVGALAMARRR